MEKTAAIAIFESLSSGVRLDVYRLLVRQGKAGLVAGEIASTLNLPASNLSFHLKAMVHAGVISVEQEGRYMRYRADLAQMRELINYLTEECCDGQPEQCADLLIAPCTSPSCCPASEEEKQ